MIRLLMVIMLTGCASKVEEQNHDMYGPDYYEVHCIDGEIWIVSDHGSGKLPGECKAEEND